MKPSIPFALALLLSASHLTAQNPAPVGEPSLGQRVKATEPEIERLLSEYRNPEALKALEALLPAIKPEFDGKNAKTSHESFVKFMDITKGYYRAAQLAHTAGAWEKAVEYAQKARDIAKENADLCKKHITPVVEYYKNQGVQAVVVLKESADRIKELKAKANRDPGEQQELDLAMGVEREVVDSEKWMKFFQYDIDLAVRESDGYDKLIEFEKNSITELDKSIAEYKAGRGDKGKYVEAVASYPQNLVKQYPEKKDRAAYLYRLAVLAPENKKVKKEIEALISGKPLTVVVEKKGKS